MKKTIRAFALWLPFLMSTAAHATEEGNVPRPPCALSVDAGQDKTICNGSNTRLFATPSGGTAPYTYSWSGGPLSNPSKQGPVATPTNSGGTVTTTTYTVVVNDAAGCSGTDNVTISVVPGVELVANGDFETVTAAPDGRGKIENAPDWKKATGDGDLFYTGYTGCEISIPPVPPIGLCNTSPLDYNCVGIPCNHFGEQNVNIPYTSYYAGLWAGIGTVKVVNGSPALDTSLDLAVEAIGIKVPKLVIGQTYRMSFKISRAEKGEVDNLGVMPFASYKVKMSNAPVTATNFHPIVADEIKKGTVTDVLNWTPVDFTFTATNEYEYVYIESFIDTLLYLTNTGSPNIQQIRPNGLESYIYIDEVSLKYECVADTIIVADAGPDVMVCFGNTVTIGGSPTAAGGTPGYDYEWTGPSGYANNLESNPTIFPTVSGTYTVKVTDHNGHSATDDVYVNVSNMNFDAGDVTYTRCPGVITQIGGIATGGIPPYNYTWTPNTAISDNHAAQPYVNPTANTLYKCTVTDAAGCSRMDQAQFIILPTPSVSAGNDVAICEGASTTLAASVSPSGNYLYRWNGVVSNSTTTVSPTSTTNYTLEVEDDYGCKTTDAVLVTVYQRPRVTAASKEICIGDSTQIGAPATGGLSPYTYMWSNGLPNQAQHWVKPTSSTTYTVTVKDSRNCYSEVNQINVKVNPKPIANAGRDRTICGLATTGTQIGATHVASGDAGWAYSWTPTTGLSPNATVDRPTAKPLSTTTYTVTVTNAFGCKQSDAMVLTVNPTCSTPGEIGSGGTGSCLNQPPPTADAGGDKFVCSGTTITLGNGANTATGGVGPYTYSWTGPGYSSALATPNINLIQDRKAIRLVVTDACGRSSDDWVTVSMLSPTIPATPDQSACLGTPVYVGQKASGGYATSYTYTWTASTGAVPSGIPQQTVSPSQNTTYTLTVKDARNCTATDAFDVNVLMPPIVNAGPDKAICTADPAVQIGGVATGVNTGIASYQWLPVRGLDYTNVPQPMARPFVTTTYRETVVDNNGCSSSDEVTVTVSESPYISAGPNQTICEGFSAFISTTVSKGTPGFTYSWTPTNNVYYPTNAWASVYPTVTTTYTIRVTDAVGCSKDTTVTVFVNPTPVADAGPDLAICDGNSATIGVASTISSGYVNYSWNPQTGLSNPYASPTTATPHQTTVYNLRVVSDKGCEDSDQMEIQVFKSPEFVPNNSFEFEYGSANATQRGDIAKADPWFASTGNPDLFDANFTDCNPIVSPLPSDCGISPLDYNCIGVPCNHFGFRYPHDYMGGRYAGLFSVFALELNQDSYTPVGKVNLIKHEKMMTEGMEVKLKNKLEKNHDYTFEMWISKAEKGETGENLPSVIGSGEDQVLVAGAAPFSVKLSKDKVLGTNYNAVDRPVILVGAITYDGQWTKVTGQFTADDDNYEYVIIESDPGVIRYIDARSDGAHVRVNSSLGTLDVPENPLNTAFIPDPIDPSAPLEDGYLYQSYLYVDDVSIKEVCNIVPPLIVDAGPDTTICVGYTYEIGGHPSASYGTPTYTYQWTDLNTNTVIATTPNVFVSPTVPTTYELKVTDNAGVIKTDLVVVNMVVVGPYIDNTGFEFGTKPLARTQIESATDWFKATGDADLYDSDVDCSPIPNDLSPANYNCVDVPVNHFGNQNVRSGGKRYAGLWSLVQLSEATTFSGQPGVPDGPVVSDGPVLGIEKGTSIIENVVGGGVPTKPRVPPVQTQHTYTTQVAVEGIEVKFEKQLETDRFYRLSFYVSKAELGETGDNIDQLPSIGNDIDTKHLLVDECAGFHVKFSEDSVTNILYRPVDREISGSGVVCDKDNWQLYYLVFKPTANFKYLVIESYPTDGATSYLAARTVNGQTQQSGTQELSGFQSYFYIDDVELTESCTNYPTESGPGGGGGGDLKRASDPQNLQNLIDNATITQTTAVSKIEALKNAEMSLQVIPNPNSGSFSLNYSLGMTGNNQAQIVITDAVGKIIKQYSPSFNDAAKHSLDVNLKDFMGDVTAGVYMVRLINGGESLVKKVTVMP